MIPDQRPDETKKKSGLDRFTRFLAATTVIVASAALVVVTVNLTGPVQIQLPNDPVTPTPDRQAPPERESDAPRDEAEADLEHGIVLLTVSTPVGNASGTGIILDEDGSILTAYHVVENAEEAFAEVASTGQTFRLELRGYDYDRDIALLEPVGSGTDFDYATISTEEVEVGDAVSAVGNAEGQGFLSVHEGEIERTVTSSLVQSVDGSPPQRSEDVMRTDADVYSGMSGGPLFNDKGEVIGVIVIGSDGEDPYGFAVPIDESMQVVEDVRNDREVDGVITSPTGSLGILTVNSREDTTRGSNLAQQAVDGLEVIRFLGRSSAQHFGIHRGDVITAINGTPVIWASDLSEILRDTKPRDTAIVTVYRHDTGAWEDIELLIGRREWM